MDRGLIFALAVQHVGSQQKKRSAPQVDDKRMRALAAAMVRESEREALQGIRLELEQVCHGPHCILAMDKSFYISTIIDSYDSIKSTP